MLELFTALISNNKEEMLKNGWAEIENKEDYQTKFSKNILVLQSLTKITISLLDTFINHTKSEKNVPMTYTTEYRLRLRIGQFVCLLVQAFDHTIINSKFRENLCEVDPIGLILEKFGDALHVNNAPALRHFMEIATTKFAIEYPDEVLNKLVIPNMINLKSNIQLRNSAVFVKNSSKIIFE